MLTTEGFGNYICPECGNKLENAGEYEGYYVSGGHVHVNFVHVCAYCSRPVRRVELGGIHIPTRADFCG